MKTKGNAIAQYGIIIALVALALVPVFYLFGKNIVDYFANFKNMLGGNNTNVVEQPVSTTPEAMPPAPVATAAIKAGELGGTPDQPQLVCKNGICAIDYGDFVLNGIPENFQEFAQAAGISGGTDKLISLIEQIAEQLEADEEHEKAAQLRQLANLGHAVADIDKLYEDIAENCIGNEYEMACLTNNLSYGSADIQFYEDIDALVPDFSPEHPKEIYDSIDIGYARYLKNFEPGKYEDLKTSLISIQMVEIFDSIMNDPGYSDSMKTVTTELLKNLSDLNYQMRGLMMAGYYAGRDSAKGSYDLDKYDPITGENTGKSSFSREMGLEDIISPEISNKSDIKSALICATGEYDDTGKVCE